MFIFVFLEFVSTVLAPVTTIPLIPIASNLWGWQIAGALSVLGWFLGAMVAFEIARRYGIPIVKKFVPLKNLRSFEGMIPEKNLFWGVVFLRLIIPVDILSYTLGLFSRIGRGKYALATFIGIIPFSFLIAYLGTVTLKYQIIALVVGSTAFIIICVLQASQIRKRLRLPK